MILYNKVTHLLSFPSCCCQATHRQIESGDVGALEDLEELHAEVHAEVHACTCNYKRRSDTPPGCDPQTQEQASAK